MAVAKGPGLEIFSRIKDGSADFYKLWATRVDPQLAELAFGQPNDLRRLSRFEKAWERLCCVIHREPSFRNKPLSAATARQSRHISRKVTNGQWALLFASLRAASHRVRLFNHGVNRFLGKIQRLKNARGKNVEPAAISMSVIDTIYRVQNP